MVSFGGNRVVQHTGARFPIFQAPIGLISRADLVAAVAAAGGVGLMETASLPIPELQEQFDLACARSPRPFGLHLMIPVLAARPDKERAVLDWALAGIRKATDLTAADIAEAMRGHDNDLDAAAERLRVSRRGLKLRMKALGVALP